MYIIHYCTLYIIVHCTLLYTVHYCTLYIFVYKLCILYTYCSFLCVHCTFWLVSFDHCTVYSLVRQPYNIIFTLYILCVYRTITIGFIMSKVQFYMNNVHLTLHILHNYRFVSPVPQDGGFLDPNPDLQNMRIHGAKY